MSARSVLKAKVMTSLNGKFILIIDDDTAMLRALTKVLAGEGGLVTSASWAGEAMDHLTDRFERFDLVITDLRMPFLGGETILRAVKTALPSLPVIVITAFGNPDLKTDCLTKGASAFLEKPLETAQLLEAVDQALAPGGEDRTQGTYVESGEDKPGGSSSGGKRDPFKHRGGT